MRDSGIWAYCFVVIPLPTLQKPKQTVLQREALKKKKTFSSDSIRILDYKFQFCFYILRNHVAVFVWASMGEQLLIYIGPPPILRSINTPDEFRKFI